MGLVILLTVYHHYKLCGVEFFIGIIVDSMQIAQKLEAEEEGKQGDQPVTRKDFEALLAKIETLEVLARDSQIEKDR